jgi:cyclohexyl-isocyanide hydratase
MNRRQFAQASAIASLIAASRAGAHGAHGASNKPDAPKAPVVSPKTQAAKDASETQHLEAMKKYAHLMEGKKLTIAMLAYPGMFPLDLIGPLTVFEALMNRDIHIVWKNLDVVRAEKPEHPNLVPIHPTTTFKDCPKELDVLFVPGGVPGTLTMMDDPEVLAFLRDRGSKARYVTSVCTGSLILGAAGLLDGYKAASYWATVDSLKHFGAIPTRERVVTDRNRITGGGVTAGIDFALQLVAKLRNVTYAQALQLYLEYDPAPPFNAGSPSTAPKIVTEFMSEMFAGLNQAVETIAKKKRR